MSDKVLMVRAVCDCVLGVAVIWGAVRAWQAFWGQWD